MEKYIAKSNRSPRYKIFIDQGPDKLQ